MGELKDREFKLYELQADSMDLFNELNTKMNLIDQKIKSLNNENSSFQANDFNDEKTIGPGEQIRTILYDMLRSSTGHGLANCMNSRLMILKVFWAVCIFAAYVACIVFIYESMESYYRYEILSSLKTIPTQKMVFPAVRVCTDVDRAPIYLHTSSYNDRPANVDFVTEYIYNKKCFTFNNGVNSDRKLYKVERVGKSYGLKIRLWMRKDNPYTTVFIIDNYYFPSRKEVGQLYLLKGQVTNLILRKNVQERLGTPYSNCENGLEYNNALYSDLFKTCNGYEYRRVNCVDLFKFKKLQKKCNCTYTASENDDSNCFIQKCYSDEEQEFLLTKRALDYCRVECKSTMFHVDSQVLEINPSAYDLAQHTNFTKLIGIKMQPMQKNALWLNIFFDELEYHLNTELPATTIRNKIAELGGFLGLFLGLSLLSLLEFVEFSIRVLAIVGK